MSILFGHPTGNPNSHQAALAHFERARLEAFCVPWMPSRRFLRVLHFIPRLSHFSRRLERRSFQPLERVQRIRGPIGECLRLAQRALLANVSHEKLSYSANDWLMRTMARECRRPSVTAVHSYEDCSLWQFTEAKRLNKACIYDMPIGYYPAWESTQAELFSRYADWLPRRGSPASIFVRPEQKKREMALADLVFAPSLFVRNTIELHINKHVILAPYGVDSGFWRPGERCKESGQLHFVYVGQCSLRKGIPVLLEAWEKADLKDARLELVGSWHLTEGRRNNLPRGVTFSGPVASENLLSKYQAADVFVFPSFFEGQALVVGEALACGLPLLTSDASGWAEVSDERVGRVFPSGDTDALVDSLRWYASHRESLPEMRRAARAKAETCTWENYRRAVSEAVAPFV